MVLGWEADNPSSVTIIDSKFEYVQAYTKGYSHAVSVGIDFLENVLKVAP